MKNIEKISLTQKAVKMSANLVIKVAKSDVNATSWTMIHQPKVPIDLAKRLEAIDEK